MPLISQALICSLIAPPASQSLKLARKAGISAGNNSFPDSSKLKTPLPSHVSLCVSVFIPSRKGTHRTSIPLPTLRHLHAKQITELDLSDVVGNVFLFRVSAQIY